MWMSSVVVLNWKNINARNLGCSHKGGRLSGVSQWSYCSPSIWPTPSERWEICWIWPLEKMTFGSCNSQPYKQRPNIPETGPFVFQVLDSKKKTSPTQKNHCRHQPPRTNGAGWKFVGCGYGLFWRGLRLACASFVDVLGSTNPIKNPQLSLASLLNCFWLGFWCVVWQLVLWKNRKIGHASPVGLVEGDGKTSA